MKSRQRDISKLLGELQIMFRTTLQDLGQPPRDVEGRSGTPVRLSFSVRYFAFIFSLILTFSLHAFAQYDSASVLGTLRDHSGSALAKGNVVLINLATGTKQTAISNDNGNYEFGSVKPGEYRLTAELSGFKTARTDTFTVTVGARQRVDLLLEVGGTSESVVVSGAAAVLETDSSDRGEVVNQREIVNLPLNGRSYADLALLVPGVRKSFLENQTLSSRDSSFNVNGQRSELNNFILDGLDNNLYGTDNQGFSNQTIQPSPDALSEFKVMTDNYSAEYGRVVGGVVNAATRSGTSQFHGSVWEYLRNTSLNAIGPFLPPQNALTGQYQKPVYQQNQFGGTFGGPLKMPFLRDKQFFFVDYEGERRVTRSLATATIPNADQRAGRFRTPVMNPYTGQVYQVDPTTGFAQVPASQITPLAQLVMQNLPTTNVAALSNNYVSLPRGSLDDNKGDARYDVYFNPKLNAFFRYSERQVNIFDPPNIPGPDGGNSNGNVTIFNQQVAYGMTYVASNNTLLDARIGFSWVEGRKVPPTLGQPSMLAQAGIPNIPTDPRIAGALNSQSISNFSSFGRQTTSPNVQNPYVVNPKVNYSWLHGAHSLKFGYEYQYIIVADDDFHPKYGNDTYSGAFSTPPAGTPKPASSPSSAEVNEDIALTDFFFGARSHYELNNTHIANINQRLHQWYAQDDWHILQNLTLNIGLRYELGTPEWESNNQLANFDPVTSPITGQLITAKSGSIYDRALINMQKNNFAPRIGFAYQVRPGTVIRSGYGISYTHFVREGGENLLVYNPPFSFNAQVNQIAPLATNGQPLCTSTNQNPASCFRPTQQGYTDGFTSASNYNPLIAQPHYTPKNDPNGYAETWHLTVQQQLGKNTTFDIAYVGLESKHLPTLADYNEAAPQAANCLTNVSTCRTVQQRRTLQNFAGIEIAFGAGEGNYHALQAKIEHRYSSGLYLLNSFTWSHAIDNASGTLENNNGDTNFLTYRDPNYDRGHSGYDQPFTDTTSVVYDLPIGRGHRFGASGNPFVRGAVGGWQFTAIHTATSGLPINLTYSAGNYKLGSLPSDAFALTAGAASSGTLYAQRPNVTGDPVSPKSRWVKTGSALNGYLNPNTVVLPTDPSKPLGNVGRNPVSAPGFSQLDLGLHKTFGLGTETGKMDFRTEAFNVLNQVNYQAPNGTRTDGTFGSITSAYPARQLQFALKLLF
jgi:Carboxypeptidase regulatory-like domain/TonB-dependent Receptor Plug Domain